MILFFSSTMISLLINSFLIRFSEVSTSVQSTEDMHIFFPMLIKVFSTFFFANQDTKTPFYISLISVILNILISVYFFREIGFIIIPIATTISSWFNAIILFVYLKNKDLFNFNELFFAKLTKILLASILMGIFFNYLILFFQNKLIYEYNFKSFYLILSAFLSFIFYLSFSLFIKAFKYGDIKLKY